MDAKESKVSAVYIIVRKHDMMTEFEKYASLDRGISTATLGRYNTAAGSQFNSTADIFSRLLADRIIFLGVGIDSDVANIIQAQLLFLASQDDKADITMYINSPGGEVCSGLAIYDTMQLISPPVGTICTGLAASMGSILLCAGAFGRRAALPHSRIMIHQPLGGASGQASDILIAAEEIRKAREELCSIIADHSSQPLDKVMSDADRNFWMNSREALSYGMIDHIIGKTHPSP